MVFFFKQETAYEMRISDWSSDVCSSDLLAPDDDVHMGVAGVVVIDRDPIEFRAKVDFDPAHKVAGVRRQVGQVSAVFRRDDEPELVAIVLAAIRSEEHTSELQSLMRISYAVFCLKKKKNKKTQIDEQT